MALSARLSDITVQQGQDVLTRYQFNTGQAQHFLPFLAGDLRQAVLGATFLQTQAGDDAFGVKFFIPVQLVGGQALLGLGLQQLALPGQQFWTQ